MGKIILVTILGVIPLILVTLPPHTLMKVIHTIAGVSLLLGGIIIVVALLFSVVIMLWPSSTTPMD